MDESSEALEVKKWKLQKVMKLLTYSRKKIIVVSYTKIKIKPFNQPFIVYCINPSFISIFNTDQTKIGTTWGLIFYNIKHSTYFVDTRTTVSWRVAKAAELVSSGLLVNNKLLLAWNQVTSFFWFLTSNRCRLKCILFPFSSNAIGPVKVSKDFIWKMNTLKLKVLSAKD